MNALTAFFFWFAATFGGHGAPTPEETCQAVRSGETSQQACTQHDVAPGPLDFTSISNGF